MEVALRDTPGPKYFQLRLRRRGRVRCEGCCGVPIAAIEMINGWELDAVPGDESFPHAHRVHIAHGFELVQNDASLVDDFLRFGILAALQVSVEEEVVGVEGVRAVAMVFGFGVLGGGDGKEVGVDVLLPHS